MAVNDILSPEMHVDPLEEGEVAVYKLLNAEKKQKNMHFDNGEPVISSPAGVSFEGRDYVIDRFDKTKQRKMISYDVGIETMEDTSGRPYDKKLIGRIDFNGTGVKLVKPDDFPMYSFMERMNANISNPYRNKKKKAYFFRVNKEKEQVKQTDTIRLAWEAYDLVLHNSKVELESLIKNLPPRIRPNMNKSWDFIMGELSKLAQENPRAIVVASGNRKSLVRLKIRDAHKFDLILFDDAERKWYLKDKDGMQELTDVPVGKDMYRVLVSFFLNPINKKHYDIFLEAMNRLQNA